MKRLNTMILYIFIGGLMVFFFGKCLPWVSFYGLKPILSSYLLWWITVNKRRYNLQLKKLSRKNEMYSYKYVIIIFLPGGVPYPMLTNTELYRLLGTGYRMERPDMSSDDVYVTLLRSFYNNYLLTDLIFFPMPLFCCKLHRTSLQTSKRSNYLAIFFIFIQLNSHVKWSVFQNPENFC